VTKFSPPFLQFRDIQRIYDPLAGTVFLCQREFRANTRKKEKDVNFFLQRNEPFRCPLKTLLK